MYVVMKLCEILLLVLLIFKIANYAELNLLA